MPEQVSPQGIKDPIPRDTIERVQNEPVPSTTAEERILARADGTIPGATGAGVVYAGLTGPTGPTGNVGPSPQGPRGATGMRGPTGP
jgi:hypothetical protein